MELFTHIFVRFFYFTGIDSYNTDCRPRKTILTLLTFQILLFLSSVQAWGATHTVTEAMGVTIRPTTFSPDAVPGDTIIIDENRVTRILFDDFDGTPANPYIFTNPSDAKVTISTGSGHRIEFYDSDNFKLLGNNYGEETYGIEISAVGTTHMGIRLWRCADWEIAYIHIHDVLEGVTHNSDPGWTESNSLGSCRMHHCLVEDTGEADFSEGVYFGKGDVGDFPQWTQLEIDHNEFDSTGADGIQVSQAQSLLVHDNNLTDIGTRENSSHSFGILVGTESAGIEIYRNTIIRSRCTSISIMSNAIGPVSIHDNVVWDAGYGTVVWGGYGIRVRPTEGTSSIVNNTIVESDGWGIYTTSGDTTGILRYNLLVANDSSYHSDYSTKNDNRVSSSISGEYFQDPSSGNFRLTINSPAKDAGQGSGYSTIDRNGATRPFSTTAPDVGAYEFGYQGVGPNPPTHLRVIDG